MAEGDVGPGASGEAELALWVEDQGREPLSVSVLVQEVGVAGEEVVRGVFGPALVLVLAGPVVKFVGACCEGAPAQGLARGFVEFVVGQHEGLTAGFRLFFGLYSQGKQISAGGCHGAADHAVELLLQFKRCDAGEVAEVLTGEGASRRNQQAQQTMAAVAVGQQSAEFRQSGVPDDPCRGRS
ncbi:hypothetical protein WKI67_00055 [Streptomyces sp. MS2.AVA.5]|uniref:Uncharacterized protein n=1 Tax=Streptomyces achmelvichensis TaxID=3134111 RepID=A0ACC6PKI1_9ACTN